MLFFECEDVEGSEGNDVTIVGYECERQVRNKKIISLGVEEEEER